MMCTRVGFELDEEGLVFDAQPEAFVLLAHDPIVWTVRGIRHFGPRFRLLGIRWVDVKTSLRFKEALRRWNELEWQVLAEAIQVRAGARDASLQQRCLWAILSDDPHADALVRQLELKLASAGRPSDQG